MDNANQEWNIVPGVEVVGADGDNLGRVVDVDPNYIVVEKGFFFPTEYYVPMQAISDVAGARVYLSVTRDEALNQGWDAPPADGESPVVAVPAEQEGTVLGRVPVRDGEDVLTVPLHEQELVPVTHEEEVGEVHISKEVVHEERALDVPILEERVRITRHVIDGGPTLDGDVFAEGEISIPIRAEQVELQRQARVAEEVEITKEAVQFTEHVTGTVLREDVHADDVDLEVAESETGSSASETQAAKAMADAEAEMDAADRISSPSSESEEASRR